MNPGETAAPIGALVLAAPVAGAEVRSRAANLAPADAADGGGIAISTCHRVELYVEPEARERLARHEPWQAADRLDGVAAVRHAVSLAIGLESAVLGEDQVLHQFRAGVAAARARGDVGAPIVFLADRALRAGRIARSWRPARARSLADLAVECVVAAIGPLPGRSLLVVGAGEMGRLTALAVARAGAEVSVASPTRAHAEAVAAAAGGIVVPFDPGAAGVRVDAVVIALSGPWAASDETLERLARCPVVVDLSVPAALPADVIDQLGPRLVDIDSLARPGTMPAARDRGVERYRVRLEGLRDRTVAEVMERLAERPPRDLARQLAERIERERANHLAALWQRLPELSEPDRLAISAMTAELTHRLFRPSLARLGASRGDESQVRLARELFEL